MFFSRLLSKWTTTAYGGSSGEKYHKYSSIIEETPKSGSEADGREDEGLDLENRRCVGIGPRSSHSSISPPDEAYDSRMKLSLVRCRLCDQGITE